MKETTENTKDYDLAYLKEVMDNYKVQELKNCMAVDLLVNAAREQMFNNGNKLIKSDD